MRSEFHGDGVIGVAAFVLDDVGASSVVAVVVFAAAAKCPIQIQFNTDICTRQLINYDVSAHDEQK